jgi:hypothetical protein
MSLPYDVARCEGVQCPSKGNCARHLERDVPKGETVAFAAFYTRREAGADSCDSIIPVGKPSTFDAVESEGGEL